MYYFDDIWSQIDESCAVCMTPKVPSYFLVLDRQVMSRTPTVATFVLGSRSGVNIVDA